VQEEKKIVNYRRSEVEGSKEAQSGRKKKKLKKFVFMRNQAK
jgi:hypothetical protein